MKILNRMNSIAKNIFIILALFFVPPSFSQETEKRFDGRVLDAETIKQIVEKVGEILVNGYAFPDAAKEMQIFIADRLNKGEYQNIKNAIEFGRIVTNDLRKIKNDLHLQVAYAPATVRRIRANRSQSVEVKKKALEEKIARERGQNYGFKELKLLEGNVGYLKLDFFSSLRSAGETCVAAMNYLANADAVILDLRSNSGGSPFMLKLISSYFIEDDTNLVNLEWQEEGKAKIEQHWSLPFVPGRTLFEKKLYILTSPSTFSAAEGFSYNMKTLKRATLIGEKTQGGGTAGEWEVINDSFVIFVPKYKSMNPLTNECIDIEGKGIQPHLEVPAGQALLAAHLLAINASIEKAKPLKPDQELNWIKDWIEAKYNPSKFDSSIYGTYVGRYDEKFDIYFENGSLCIREHSSNIEYPGFFSKLIPLSERLFALEKVHFVRVSFEKDKNQNMTALLLYTNGNRVKAVRQ